MRVGVVTLLVVCTLACGDDDAGGLPDSGYSTRDASIDAGCLPFYLSASDRNHDGGLLDGGATLSCDFRPGTLDSECANIDWNFAGGEHIDLAGCCAAEGQCGLLDPTGVLGCVARDVFGETSIASTVGSNNDAGNMDAGGNDSGS